MDVGATTMAARHPGRIAIVAGHLAPWFKVSG